MFNQRSSLKTSALGSFLLMLKQAGASGAGTTAKNNPVVVSTWARNAKANKEAWKIWRSGGRALDAVEAGVQIPEAGEQIVKAKSWFS
jgi:N4-(beta-N-acetylglucosaminyl)-L-asparaginase